MPAALIVDTVRTATGKGKAGGTLAGMHPVNLAAAPVEALVRRTGIEPVRSTT